MRENHAFAAFIPAATVPKKQTSKREESGRRSGLLTFRGAATRSTCAAETGRRIASGRTLRTTRIERME
jgi:hypothetical protein